MSALNPVYRTGDPAELTLLDVNARYMTKTQYAQLVDNIRTDGALTSVPLVWSDIANGRKVVLSGNHRVKASIDAGLSEIGWLEIDEPLDRQRQIALQLSHNAIVGQDDPAVLKQLFDELENVEWREFAGLDDKTLDMLAHVEIEPMSEGKLDYRQLNIMMLPTELDRAVKVVEQIRSITEADQYWAARLDQFDRLLDALETARLADDVKATAVALDVILDVFEDHIGDLSSHFDEETATAKQPLPLAPVLGISVTPGTMALVRKALARHKDNTGHEDPETALAEWARAYLERS